MLLGWSGSVAANETPAPVDDIRLSPTTAINLGLRLEAADARCQAAITKLIEQHRQDLQLRKELTQLDRADELARTQALQQQLAEAQAWYRDPWLYAGVSAVLAIFATAALMTGGH